MPDQPSYQLRWALFEPDKVQPHVSGKTAFVGHTEQASGEVLDLGFVTCLDAACWRYGWLTAIDVRTGKIWQASRWGLLREAGEETHRGRLAPLFKTSG
jgi:serine/threonine protein phosphatase 1